MNSVGGQGLSDGSSLVPMSCDFYAPEVAVTTFQLSLAAGAAQLGRSQFPTVPVLVKGCERRFALEDCDKIRLCTPSYYREDGTSLIWDMQEGVVVSSPRVEERLDNPADLDEERQIDTDKTRRLPFDKAIARSAITSLRVRETEESSLTYGDSCLIWCSSIKPCNNRQWSLWRASLEPSYDHISTIRDPHVFARALGAMAYDQKGLLGNAISFRNPETGHISQCSDLPVVYGPVIYVDDRRAYIEESSSDLEFMLRSVFAKNRTHRNQREYRFAILTNHSLRDNTLDLTVSTEMRWTVTMKQRIETSERTNRSPVFRTCLPSPNILRCLTQVLPGQRSTNHSRAAFTAQIRSSFHLEGVQHKDITRASASTHRVEDIDYEYIERLIAVQPGSPCDARIIKFILDAGPGSRVTVYDLSGLSGTFRLTKRSGVATLTFSLPNPRSNNRQVLVNNSDFDGSSILTNRPNGLTLSYTPTNPATTVRTEILAEEDSVITVIATSEDGTATTSFQVIFDRSLGINVMPTEQAPAD
ncbi:MAG: hypothetical protein OXP73_01570 [Chloroflexota bacterium]|nr:hypothetical protein [Chloroflexota bacterium]